MDKKRHPDVDVEMLNKLEEHAKIRDAGFVDSFSVADAIKADARDNIPVDASLASPPPKSTVEEPIPEEPEEVSVPEEPDHTMYEDEPIQDQPPEDPEERLEWTIKQMEASFPNHPSKEQIRTWKSAHGDIFVCNFGERLFVYRYLKRIEWTQMQKTTRMDEMTQDQLEHIFIQKCLLFPAVTETFLYNMPAGLITMLFQQIQMNSGFMNPEYLTQFTIKL